MIYLSFYKVEYLFIPRSEGDYTIPGIEFSYFDTDSKSYKVLTTPDYTLHVLKGDPTSEAAGASTSFKKADLEVNSDISYIHTQPIDFNPHSHRVYATPLHWLSYLVPAVVSLLLFIFFRRQIRQNADIAGSRNRKAKKAAKQRLKQADKLCKADKRNEFYEEIMKASWTYVSDKLAIPTSSLTKENVSEALAAHGATETQIASFSEIVNACEYARYAPSTDAAAMEKLYRQTSDLIGSLEDVLN